MTESDRILVYEMKNRFLRAAKTVSERLDLMPCETENLKLARALACTAISKLNEAARYAATEECNPNRRKEDK